MEMPSPQEAHARLGILAGEWTGEEHMHPSPWDPKGGTALGRVHNRAALDGFAVVQDYEQERNGNLLITCSHSCPWDPRGRCGRHLTSAGKGGMRTGWMCPPMAHPGPFLWKRRTPESPDSPHVAATPA